MQGAACATAADLSHSCRWSNHELLWICYSASEICFFSCHLTLDAAIDIERKKNKGKHDEKRHVIEYKGKKN